MCRSGHATRLDYQSFDGQFESLTPYDFDVRVKGDTTTVTGRMVVRVMLEGQIVSSRFS